MKLIEADKVKQAIKDYWKAQVDRAPIPKSTEEYNAYVNCLDAILERNDGLLKAIDELPPAEPDTTTHDPIPAETGENDGDGTSGDCISRQSEQSACEYCHEDSDGYVLSVEKNGHAYIQNGKLALRANGWWGECAINYCPMCGRKLRGDKHEAD